MPARIQNTCRINLPAYVVIETIDHPTSHYSFARSSRRGTSVVKHQPSKQSIDSSFEFQRSFLFPGILRSPAHARGGNEPIETLEDAPAGKLKRRAVAATTQTRLEGTRTWAFVGVGCVFFRARSRSQGERRFSVW